MKKLLYLYVVLQIIIASVSFFLLLSSNPFLSLLELALSGLGVVPALAIIRNMDDLEQFRGELSYVQYKVMKLEEAENADGTAGEPTALMSQISANTWVCVKCDTVNKPDTSRCAHCSAAYSAVSNPTDSLNAKRKRSRWIK